MKTIYLTILFLVLSACAVSESYESQLSTSFHTGQGKEQGALGVFKSDNSGFDTKTFFYDSGEEIVVFDTQFTPALAEDFLTYIRSQSDSVISHVVITHPNPDKFNGISVFQNLGAKIVASKKTADAMPGVHAYKKQFFVGAGMFTKESYPTLGSIDVTFEEEFEIVLSGGDRVKLKELGAPGVSSNQTVAYIEKTNSLIVGDLIHHKAHAWLEGGIVEGSAAPSLASWKNLVQSLESVSGSSKSLVYGGRGEVDSLDVVAAAQVKYLQTADQLVENYLTINRLNVEDFSSNDVANSHYAKITKEFENKFPEYELSYMIQFGVYGLVFQKLASR